ncbi:MAG: M3 family oligoendopeptidase [Anaerolineales bacterium]|jgi:pepF/M3 family oligoendopeptidase
MSDIGNLPHWDLTNVYPSLDSKQFKDDFEKLRQKIGQLEQLLDKHKISQGGPLPSDEGQLGEILSTFISQLNELLTLNQTLRAYLASFITTDSYNTQAKKLASEMDIAAIGLDRIDVRFKGWLQGIAKQEKLLKKASETDDTVARHAFFLEETLRESGYMMSEPEETLASELSLSGASAWARLQGTVTSQLKAPFERQGQVEDLPITKIINMRSDPDEAVRRQGYETELKTWKTVEETLAACLNGIKGTVNTLNQRRDRQDALHQSLDQARIDRQTFEAMMGAMKASFPIFRRYWKSKAQRLGKDSLAWWDIMAPMGKSDTRFTWDEATDFILEHFSSFSQKLADFTQRAFDNNWIDAEPRDGKRGGAFCMKVPGVKESRILANFDGSLDSVSTIAHELGHAYHNDNLKDKPALLIRTPMTLAETASIFNQTIITEAALEQAGDAQEQLAILEADLMDAGQVIVDIYSRYLFEKEVFERREKSELSPAELNEIMANAQKETYGEALDPDYLQPYMWTWKPHYYSPELSFYNYPYAFGLLFGLGLFAIYETRGQSFLADYDDLLGSTGMAMAADLAARFDIDIRSSKFWEDSLAIVERRINRYVALE